MLTDKILNISDSLSTLQVLENPHPQNTIIQHIQEKILSTNKNIEFLWIPAHTDIYGNE